MGVDTIYTSRPRYIDRENIFGYWFMEKTNRMTDTQKHRENDRHRETQRE